jgi:hypothetical protein
MFAGVKEGGTEVVGRWPANVILKQGLQLEFPFTTNTRHMSYKRSGGDFIDKIPSQLEKDWFVTETGSAARFFFQVKSE